ARLWGLAGKEVLFPSYFHGVELDALLEAGARVRFYPVDRRMQVDPRQVVQRIGKETAAVYLIHYVGFPGPVEELAAICEERGVRLIEDCALALLSCLGSGRSEVSDTLPSSASTRRCPRPTAACSCSAIRRPSDCRRANGQTSPARWARCSPPCCSGSSCAPAISGVRSGGACARSAPPCAGERQATSPREPLPSTDRRCGWA